MNISLFAAASVRIRAGAAALVLAFVLPVSASANSLKTIYAFCSKTNCADGINPFAPVLMDSAGDLFGTTATNGAVFELVPVKRKWKYRTLYKFCVHTCVHGDTAESALIMDTAGNLYGTTLLGGKGERGTVFELTPDSMKTRWSIRTLYGFCLAGGSCPDGDGPDAGLTYAGAASGALYDGVSPLYGVTQVGGKNGYGTVFQVNPEANSKRWNERVLHSFCSQQQCTDGADPYASLIVDGTGNLYGTTRDGGTSFYGTVFELSPDAAKSKWTETVLYSFCALQNCADGANPVASLIFDVSGNLYGTTYNGLNLAGGTVFELVPDGVRSQLTVLYSFCALTNCTDGESPEASLIMDNSGNLLGTTNRGGSANAGTIFKLAPDGSKSQLTTLYSFCSQPNCTDGAYPDAPLTLDGSGNLFGTTANGGLGGNPGYGTVFELRP